MLRGEEDIIMEEEGRLVLDRLVLVVVVLVVRLVLVVLVLVGLEDRRVLGLELGRGRILRMGGGGRRGDEMRFVFFLLFRFLSFMCVFNYVCGLG